MATNIFLTFLLLTLSVPGLLLTDASETCTPTSNSASCERTQSCLHIFPAQPDESRVSLLDIVSYQYNIGHLQDLYNMLKLKTRQLRRLIVRLNTSWTFSTLSVPIGQRGLGRLYPVSPIEPSTADIHPTITHSHVLGELRWWLTSLEEHALQLKACGLLGAADGEDLVAKISLLSRETNYMLRYLSIEPGDFTARALCAQVSRSITDSHTKRAQYTSVALRDMERSLERIRTVLNHCSITSHTEGQHQARLECQSSYQHLFYQNRPSDVTILHSHANFLN